MEKGEIKAGGRKRFSRMKKADNDGSGSGVEGESIVAGSHVVIELVTCTSAEGRETNGIADHGRGADQES